MPKITTFLTYESRAEEAANFYVSVFENSKVLDVTRFGEGAPMPAGSVMTVTFELDGQEFVALNGGPHFKFSEAVSLSVDCETQAELDRYWSRLATGGEEGPCGWLKDKFGLSWQVVPRVLPKMLGDSDPERVRRVFEAVFQMKKIDLAALQRAYDGR